jgi:hypothetical protein
VLQIVAGCEALRQTLPAAVADLDRAEREAGDVVACVGHSIHERRGATVTETIVPHVELQELRAALPRQLLREGNRGVVLYRTHRTMLVNSYQTKLKMW